MKCLFVFLLLITTSLAGDVREQLRRAEEFGKQAAARVVRDQIVPFWSEDQGVLIYRVNPAPDEVRFVRVALETGAKSPAFDHAELAEALTEATGETVPENRLPLDAVTELEGGTLKFRAKGKSWRFTAGGSLETDDTPPPRGALIAPEDIRRHGRRSGGPTTITIENGTAGELGVFWVEPGGAHRSYGTIPAGGANTLNTYAGHLWLAKTAGGEPLAAMEAADTPSVARVVERIWPEKRPQRENLSPDGRWRAVIRRHNVFLEPTGGGEPVPLSRDGSKDDRFIGPLRWSPDSSRLVAFREKAVPVRKVHIVQSSPPDQLQPKLVTLDYAKPGDEIPQPQPRLFDVAAAREIPLDTALFPNPWEISELAWAPDSSEFSFAYNQRGHQLMRLVAITADGAARTVFEDTSPTFIDYSQKFLLRRLPESGEILWASERDGRNRLYLLDARTGSVRAVIPDGGWIVRGVEALDTARRELLLKVMGAPGQDPYQLHFLRAGLDGSVTRLTEGDGNHHVAFSPDGGWYLDTWSRPDQPPVTELRRSRDGALVAELERADDSALRATGWSRPERFVAAGRDGRTAIHGVILRPTHFDPAKRYPVVEDIYAGPQDFFVPKNFFAWSGMNTMAELGFVVVKIDGMGTNWRTKDFHDVCHKNLMDGGFPDRIPWIRAAAADRPWMDLSRVGIYGGSAGGQNALAGLLNHGDFYQAGVADCGCHDNRMDKIWWNEAWMGWPVDASYAANSNVTHAAKLTGKLMLIVGEMDTNVDPASTAQVVAALQAAGKSFDFVPIMNAGHGAAETPYGKFRRAEFLTRHLRAGE